MTSKPVFDLLRILEFDTDYLCFILIAFRFTFFYIVSSILLHTGLGRGEGKEREKGKGKPGSMVGRGRWLR